MKMTPCIVVQLVEHKSWWDGFNPGPGHTEENPTNVGGSWVGCVAEPNVVGRYNSTGIPTS